MHFTRDYMCIIIIIPHENVLLLQEGDGSKCKTCNLPITLGFGHCFCHKHSPCFGSTHVGRPFWNPQSCQICDSLANELLYSPDEIECEEARNSLMKIISEVQNLVYPMPWDPEGLPVPIFPDHMIRRRLMPESSAALAVDHNEIFPPGFEPDGYIPPEHTTTTSDVENCESGGGYISELEEDSTQNTDSNNYEPPGDYSSPHPEKPRHYTRKEDPKIKQSDYLKKTGTPVTQEALTSFLTSFASELQSSLLHKASANVQKHISQELNNIKHQMRSSNPPHSRLPPIEDLPPTSADNPWQSCEGTFIINEKFIVAGSSWELHKVQFWPGRKDHPNCFWRIELSAFQSKTIPSETVICGVGEAREVACKIANKAGFKMIEKWGALGSKEPLFLCEKDLTE